jgi:hypothetical protein
LKIEGEMMKKFVMKMAIVAAILVPLIWAVPGQTETIIVGNGTVSREFLDPAFYFSQFPYSNIAVVDYMKYIPRNGKVTGFRYYAVNTNPFYFMLLDGSFIVKWVSEKITPQGTGVNVYSLTSYVPVQSGWMIGVFLTSNGAIPFDFNLPGGSGTVYLYNSSLPTVDSPFAYEGISNRTYSFAATVVTDEPQPGQSVDVTLVKYLDGKHAGAVSASGNSFPLLASWGDPKDPTSGGSDYFYLGPDGVNTENSYEAKSPVIPVGSFYSVAEDTAQGAVGPNCANGQFSRLLGYTAGDTLDRAITAARTTTAPSLRNIGSNKYVIVWNETCGTDDDDECDNDDNGHHYGNDKGDNHRKCKHGYDHHKCKHGDNGHHYGNDKGDHHQSPNDKNKDKDGGKR